MAIAKKTIVKTPPFKPTSVLQSRFVKEPETLSHYTSLAGMVGILDSRELWASNVSFLNDREELLYGLKAAKAVVNKYLSPSTKDKWAQDIEDAISQLQNGEMPDTYAACFCARNDSLSQWRGYGGEEQGVALTFDRTRLLAQLNDKGTLLPVVYGALKSANQLSTDLGKKLRAINKEAVLNIESADRERVDRVRVELSRLLPQFKHSGFRDENEWRFVVQQTSSKLSTFFRVKSNVLVPYVKLSFEQTKAFPIKSIRIGPGRDQNLTKRSVEQFLVSKKMKNIDVIVSGVPYRSF
jgi:hypothetical protein